jgi:hypothetical protein
MRRFHEVISKKWWFVLFNLGTLVALALSGRLTSSLESAIASLIALLIVNGIAAVSARNFPNWR